MFKSKLSIMSIVILVGQLSYSGDNFTANGLFNRQKNMKIGCLVEVFDERDPLLGIPETIGIKYFKNEEVTQSCKINESIRSSTHNDCQYVLEGEIKSLNKKDIFKVKAKFVTTAILDPSIKAKLPLMLSPGLYFSLNSDSNYVRAELKDIQLENAKVKYEMDSIHIVNDGMGIRWGCKLYEE